jgi:hypothetical protein
LPPNKSDEAGTLFVPFVAALLSSLTSAQLILNTLDGNRINQNASVSMIRNGSCFIAPFIVVALAGCFGGLEINPKEEARVTSPDSLVDAVLSEANCGAACPFIYHVSIVPRGDPPAGVPKYDLFTADYVSGLRLQWAEPRVLEIVYDSARIHYFTNHWSSEDVENYDYVVELRLVGPDHGRSLTARNRRSDSIPARD